MSDELYIWATRWDEFQTYHTKRGKTWTPPWIRVYARLLDDHNYLGLTLRQRAILHGIWLALARARLVLGSSPASVRFALGDPTVRARDLEALNNAGFIEFCSRTVLEQKRHMFWNCSNLEVEKEGELQEELALNKEPLTHSPRAVDEDIDFQPDNGTRWNTDLDLQTIGHKGVSE